MHSKTVTSTLRLRELLDDVFAQQDNENIACWPTQDYARAAEACAGDLDSIEKLKRLCDDLELLVTLNDAPASFVRLAEVPLDILKALQGLCWREVLLNEHLPPLAWQGIAAYGRALLGSGMDSHTCRTAAVLFTAAVARLKHLAPERICADDCERFETLRASLAGKTYLIEPLRRILKSA